MWNWVRERAIWWAPAAALGLYGGRVVSERWAYTSHFQPASPVLITIITLLLALMIVRGHRLSETWPLLLLFGYVFYPEPYPAAWMGVGLLTAVCLAQVATDDLKTRHESRWSRATRHRLHQALLALVGLGLATLYLLTLTPGLLPADSGELQLVAANLGVAHPPGFPLYTLLAHLMTWLPLGATPAWRTNLFSLITSTLTLLLIFQMVWLLTRRYLAAITAVTALGTATTFWAQATTTNIRSLTGLMAALAFWAAIRFYLEVSGQKQPPDWKVRDRWLVVLALTLSLGVTHHLSLAFMGLLIALFVILVDPTILKMPQRWPRPLLAAFLGLLPLLYLPLRAGSGARGAAADLATWDGFVQHLLGLGFQGDFFYFTDPLVLGLRLGVMGNVMTFQFSAWLLLGMVVGWLLLMWQEWKLGLLLGLSFAIHTLITAVYRAPQTVEYMIPAYIPVVICLGYGIGAVDRLSAAPTQRRLRPWMQLFTAVMLVAAIFQGWRHGSSYRQLHFLEDTRDYAQTLLQAAPPQSTLLANWHWVTPLWYLQEVEGQRPDVTVRYIAPGVDPYGDTWANTIATEWENGRDVIATWFDAPAYAALPPPEPLYEAFWFRQEPRTSLPDGFTPLAGTLGSQIQLLGYGLNQTETEIGQEVVLTLAWQPLVPFADDLAALNAHLIGFDGRSYAQSDQRVRPQAEGITLTQFRLTPRLGALPGTYALRLGSEEATAVIDNLSVTPMSRPPLTQQPQDRPAIDADQPRRLIGVDGDHTLPSQIRTYWHWRTENGYITEVQDGQMAVPRLGGVWGLPGLGRPLVDGQPAHYVPLGDGIVWTGQALTPDTSPLVLASQLPFPQQFRAAHPLLRDYVASVRLVGYEADGFHWAWCDLVDYVPAMGAIPTLKWIGGSRVTSPHLISYPAQAPAYNLYCQSIKPAPGAPVLAVDGTAVPGQAVGGTLVLYDAFTQRPLPILDERIASQFPWIPLGQTSIAPAP